MIKKEWRNITKNAWIMIVLFAVILIPSIYATVFLGSMWDPYGKTSEIPVAVVNEDQEVEYHDKTLAVGKELTEKLKENDSMKFQTMNAEQAKKGLEDGTYYMVITIPENFSQNATTLLEEKPEKMELIYTTNPGTNYIASKMDDSAMEKINKEISESVTKTYTETIFEQISKLSDGLQTAADGSKDLDTGVDALREGNQTITENLALLAESSKSFENGSSQLTNGVETYTDGVKQVYDGATALSEKNEMLTKGMESFSSGMQEISKGNKKIYQGLQSLSGKLQESTSKENQENIQSVSNGNLLLSKATDVLKGLLSNPQTNAFGTLWMERSLSQEETKLLPIGDDVKKILEQYSYTQLVSLVTSGNTQVIQALNNGISELNCAVNGGKLSDGTYTQGLLAGSAALQNGIKQAQEVVDNSLKPGVKQYTDAVTQMQEGLQKLTNKNAELIAGSKQLTDGVGQLQNGAEQLAKGSSALTEGLDKVKEGTFDLRTGLEDGAKESRLTTNESTLDMMAAPVELKHEEISTVKNNGHAMAPYMMSVALYVAGMAFVLMYPLRNNIKEAKNGFRYWLGKASVMYTISTAAAIVLITALIQVNGFEPERLGMTYLFACLVSAAFMSLIVLLNLTTGFIGDFILLVFMILNLGGAAGTYPLETSGSFYQMIHKFVPYTYSVNGFRKVISMSNTSVLQEISVMVGIILVCTLLMIVYFYKKNTEDKHKIPQAFVC